MKATFQQNRTLVFWGTALIVFLVQLRAVVIVSSNKFGLPVNFDKVIVVLTLAYALWLTWSESMQAQRVKPKPLQMEPGLRIVGLYMLGVILSFFFAEIPPNSIGVIETTIGALLYFVLVLYVGDTARRIEILLAAIMAATCVSASVVLYDIITGSFLFTMDAPSELAIADEKARSGGAYGESTGGAAMILVGCLAGVILAIYPNRFRWLAAATVVLGTSALVMSFARSAGLVYLIVLFFISLRLRGHRHFKLILIIGTICMLVVLAVMPDRNWERLAALMDFDRDRTLWRRVSYNIIGLDLLAQFPLFGVGPKNFPTYFLLPDYRWIPGRTADPRVLHNIYLQIAVHHGIVGLAPFLALVLYAFGRVRRVMQEALEPQAQILASAVFYASLGFFLVCVFMPAQNNRYIWILLALMIAMHRLVPRKQRRVSSIDKVHNYGLTQSSITGGGQFGADEKENH